MLPRWLAVRALSRRLRPIRALVGEMDRERVRAQQAGEDVGPARATAIKAEIFRAARACFQKVGIEDVRSALSLDEERDYGDDASVGKAYNPYLLRWARALESLVKKEINLA